MRFVQTSAVTEFSGDPEFNVERGAKTTLFDTPSHFIASFSHDDASRNRVTIPAPNLASPFRAYLIQHAMSIALFHRSVSSKRHTYLYVPLAFEPAPGFRRIGAIPLTVHVSSRSVLGRTKRVQTDIDIKGRQSRDSSTASHPPKYIFGA